MNFICIFVRKISIMSKHLLPFFLLMASIQVFASLDPTLTKADVDYKFQWELPTTLDGIRQERANMKITEEPIPVSIMCEGHYYNMSLQDEAVNVNKEERYWTVKRDLTLASVPYIALGIAAHAIKKDIRKVNNDINSGFHNRADDYIQYAPMLLTYGLKATGYEGRSQWGRLLASNAFSAIIMAGLVNGIKYSAAEERPDGSTSNSFPSGHTATAFMAATILHKEYGLTRSLWYSVGGYAVATGIGAFRVMNNRHWVSDVMTGAGIGILSTELGYAISDLIFKDKYTLRREMENLNDLSEHPSFFSLQAGVGFVMGGSSLPDEIAAVGGPGSIKRGASTVIGAEAAYFLNSYLGFGLRARINSTAVTPRWDSTEDVWTSGTWHYNNATNQYEHPNTADANYKHSTDTHKDQLSSFDLMGGIYGGLPLNKRMSLGAKLLFGRRQSGDVWYLADMSGSDDEFESKWNNLQNEVGKVDQMKDINTYDRVKGIDLDGKGSFMMGTGISFSYALKHNIVWRVGLDYDYTRARYEYYYLKASLVDMANHYLAVGDGSDMVLEKEGTFRRNQHQITPSFGICFSF